MTPAGIVFIADSSSAYVFSGVLTIAAALIVIVVMMATSESKDRD